MRWRRLPTSPAVRTLLRIASFLIVGALMACVSFFVPSDSDAAFRRWLRADSERGVAFARFEQMLQEEGVSGVVPHHQLWLVDRIEPKCATAPFVAPPEQTWRNIVPALRFIRDHVEPAVGEVRVVSAYRDGAFNACVHGAPLSAHRGFQALDLTPTSGGVSRDDLINTLCPIHAAAGRRNGVGLGIYAGRRFHIDARSYRGWGPDYHAGSFPCLRAPR
jgi:hypothetical protein